MLNCLVQFPKAPLQGALPPPVPPVPPVPLALPMPPAPPLPPLLPVPPAPLPPPGPVAIPPVARALSDKLQQALTLVLTNQACQGLPKRISEKLLGIEDSLSQIFAMDNEAIWPPFWQQFANAPKNTCTTLVANMLHTWANGDNGNGCFPAVLPALVEAITSAKFCTDDHMELEQGFNIFTMIMTIQGTQAVAQQTFLYMALVNGQTAPSTAELHELTRTKAQFPHTCTQALHQLKSYIMAAQELFGVNHPFTVHVMVFVQKVEKLLPKFETYWLDQQGGVSAGLTQLMYFTHMLTNTITKVPTVFDHMMVFEANVKAHGMLAMTHFRI